MYVSCSTLCFARFSLDDCLKTIRETHFNKADLTIRTNGPHLTPADVAADVGKVCTRLKGANIAYAAIDCGAYDDTPERFRAICRLARLLAVPTVTVTPPAGADLEAAAKYVAPLARFCAAEGVELCAETNAAAITGDAALAIDLCERVPGLGLTLDPSHFVGKEMDSLYPFVSHVRLRDSGTKAEEFQVRVGQGQIDYGRILSHLDRHGYDRALTVDIRDVPDSPFSVDAEVRKLKYLLESLV